MATKLYVVVFVAACASLVVAFPMTSPYHHYESELGDGEEQHQQQVREPEQEQEPQHEAPKSYHFQYAVHDPITGDVKSQNEVSDGHGTVKGTYSLLEADGSTRVVEYTADDVHGFNAEVKRIEPQHKSDEAEPQHETDDAEPQYKSEYGEPKVQSVPAPVHSPQEDEHPEYFPALFSPSSLH